MAFTFAIAGDSASANLRITYGTYTQANGDTGGEIATGLSHVVNFQATGIKNRTISGGAVTVVTADPGGDVVNDWMAFGY